jgi:hypothetical protein
LSQKKPEPRKNTIGETKERIEKPDRTIWPFVLFGPVILAGVSAFAIEAFVRWHDVLHSSGWTLVTVDEARGTEHETTMYSRFGGPKKQVRYSCTFKYKADGHSYTSTQNFLEVDEYQECKDGMTAWADPNHPENAVVARNITSWMYYNLFFTTGIIGLIIAMPLGFRLHNRYLDRIIARAREYPNERWRLLPEWEIDRVKSRYSSFISWAVLLTFTPPLIFIGVAAIYFHVDVPMPTIPLLMVVGGVCLRLGVPKLLLRAAGLTKKAELIIEGGLPLTPGARHKAELVVRTSRRLKSKVDMYLDLSQHTNQKSFRKTLKREIDLSICADSDHSAKAAFTLNLPDWDERSTNERTVRWILTVTPALEGIDTIAKFDLPVYKLDNTMSTPRNTSQT